MKIIHRTLGELETNCYILIDEETREAAVIDPADSAELLQSLIESEGASLRPGRLCDLVPTMLELMGLAQPSEMTGKSLLVK